MKRNYSIVLLGVFLIFTSGCASIVGKSMFPVAINSDPSGAEVKIIDEYGKVVFTGTTPTTVSLKAGESYFHSKSYSMTFSKEGYSEQKAVLRSEISGWYFGNIVFGGIIGALIVDPITGKMWKLPVGYTASLSTQSAKNQVPKLQILSLDQVSESMRKELVAIN